VDASHPADHAQTTRRPQPVFARHAASLIVWREAAHGPEVLMGLRGAGHRFMPNRLVFPGGAVDRRDRTAQAAEEPDPATLQALRRNAQAPLARALVYAAARELEEETGLSFGTPPRLGAIRYLCRAVTPPDAKIRFNARFLIAEASAVHGTPCDSHELEGVRYYGLSEALALDLARPTRVVLTEFQTYLALTDEARRARTALPVFKRRSWVSE